MVKTPVGDTNRFEMNNIEIQGTVTAPLKCAVQIDSLGRDCYTTSRGLYHYRDACAVPPLGMIDDIAGASHCQDDSVILNAIVNAKIESKYFNSTLKSVLTCTLDPTKKSAPN